MTFVKPDDHTKSEPQLSCEKFWPLIDRIDRPWLILTKYLLCWRRRRTWLAFGSWHFTGNTYEFDFEEIPFQSSLRYNFEFDKHAAVGKEMLREFWIKQIKSINFSLWYIEINQKSITCTCVHFLKFFIKKYIQYFHHGDWIVFRGVFHLYSGVQHGTCDIHGEKFNTA